MSSNSPISSITFSTEQEFDDALAQLYTEDPPPCLRQVSFHIETAPRSAKPNVTMVYQKDVGEFAERGAQGIRPRGLFLTDNSIEALEARLNAFTEADPPSPNNNRYGMGPYAILVNTSSATSWRYALIGFYSDFIAFDPTFGPLTDQELNHMLAVKTPMQVWSISRNRNGLETITQEGKGLTIIDENDPESDNDISISTAAQVHLGSLIRVDDILEIPGGYTAARVIKGAIGRHEQQNGFGDSITLLRILKGYDEGVANNWRGDYIAAARMVQPSPINTSEDYTVKENDQFIAVDASGGPVTITLRDPTRVDFYHNRQRIISKIDSSANTVKVTVELGKTIDGVDSVTLNNRGSSVTVINNRVEYKILRSVL